MALPVTVNPKDLFDSRYTSRIQEASVERVRVRRRSSTPLTWSHEDPSIAYNERVLGLPLIPQKPLPAWVYQELQKSEKRENKGDDSDEDFDYPSDFVSEDEEPHYSLNTLLYSPKVPTRMNWTPSPGPISSFIPARQGSPEVTATPKKLPFYDILASPQLPLAPAPSLYSVILAAPWRNQPTATNNVPNILQPSLKRKRVTNDNRKSTFATPSKTAAQQLDTKPRIACRWATPTGEPCTTTLSQDCFKPRGNSELKKHLEASHGFQIIGMFGEEIIECKWAIDTKSTRRKHCAKLQYGSLNRHMRTRGHIMSEDPNALKSTIVLEARRCRECGREHFRDVDGKCGKRMRTTY